MRSPKNQVKELSGGQPSKRNAKTAPSRPISAASGSELLQASTPNLVSPSTLFVPKEEQDAFVDELFDYILQVLRSNKHNRQHNRQLLS